MRIIVCMKHVLDLSQADANQTKLTTFAEGTQRQISDLDKNALEEALRLKERIPATITVIFMGEQSAKDGALEALAMGADEACVLVDEIFRDSDSLVTAEIISRCVKKIGEYNLILCGEGSTDDYSSQVGPRLAEILSIPQITYVRHLEVFDKKIIANRVLEDSVEVVEASLPALLTVTKEINEPRIPTFMQILSASDKPMFEWSSVDLDIDKSLTGLHPGIQIVLTTTPSVARKNILFKDEVHEAVEKLVKSLLEEGIVKR